MTSLMYSEDGIQHLSETKEDGLPFFRKYIFEGTIGKNELRLCRLLKLHPHPNIVAIYDIGPDYVDMELLAVNICLEQIKLFLTQLEDVKNLLHSLGIVYLDWKMDNIGMDNKGVVKIFDFDLSCTYIHQTFMETPGIQGFLFKEAQKARMSTPTEIDNWIFKKCFSSIY